MGKMKVVGFILVLAAFWGCGDDNNTIPINESFALNLTVTGPGNVPVEGVSALLHVFLPPEVLPKTTKAVAIVPFTVPVPSHVSLVVYDLDGNVVRALLDDVVAAGRHQVAFSADDQGNPLRGTHLYRCELVATDAQDEQHRRETFMTLYTAIDRDQRPLLGVTNDEGKLTFDDATEFPFLYNPGPQMRYDENKEAQGTYEFIDKVEITLYNPKGDVSTTREVVIGTGRNDIELFWDAKSAVAVAPPVMASSQPEAVVEIQRVPIPEVDFSVGPVYPTPFN